MRITDLKGYEMKEFLEGVVGVVEATSFEKMKLWDQYKNEKKVSWVESGTGYLETVGTILDRPVCLSMFTNVVDGHKILFIEATSQLVDWVMIDEWLKENLPESAFQENGIYINKQNAMNFHNVFPRGLRIEL